MISFQRSIDKYVGGALCLGWSFLPKQKNPLVKGDNKEFSHCENELDNSRSWPTAALKEILVVRLWTLGETLLTLPMIEKLREEFPNAKITVLARNRNKDIFKYVGFVDDILLFEGENLGQLRKLRGHYDLAIDTEPYLCVSGLLARFLGKTQIGFDHGVRGGLYSEKVHYDDTKHCAEIFCDLLKPLGVDYKPERLSRLEVDVEMPAKLNKLLAGKGLSGKCDFGTKFVPICAKEMKREEVVSGNYTSTSDESPVVRLDKLQSEVHFSESPKVIGMHVSTAESAQYRAWPRENFAKLIDMILENDDKAVVVLTGAPSEHKINESVIKMCKNYSKIHNLAGVLNFQQFIGLFDHLDFYISNDTGPMHLSAGQGCKTIGLFGPNLPKRFGPFPLDGKQNFALYHGDKLPCSPCINVHTGKFKKCRRLKCGTGECMTLITPEEVWRIVN